MSKLMDHGPFRVSDVTSSSDSGCFLQAADALVDQSCTRKTEKKKTSLET